MNYGVYIHIPFCRRKCGYCDFYSLSGKDEMMEPYVDALIEEIAARGRASAASGEAATLYVGGGTPTVLPIRLLSLVLQAARSSFRIAADAEITVEANPATVDLEYMTALETLGVTRLSIGAQEFNDSILRRIGRIHTARDTRDAVKWARAAGIVNVSLDLMYGLPGQTLDDVIWSVGSAMDLAVNHISVYGLTIEDGTPFSAMAESGELVLPTEEESEEMYDYLTGKLPPYGFARYEISNFAREGFESRHNIGYWSDTPYIGVGAAAASYWDGRRYTNVRDAAKYIETIGRGELPATLSEQPTRKNALEEYCFLALRMARGIEKEAFAGKFGEPIEKIYGDAIKNLKDNGLLTEENGFLRLTDKGMKLGNVAFRAFIL